MSVLHISTATPPQALHKYPNRRLPNSVVEPANQQVLVMQHLSFVYFYIHKPAKGGSLASLLMRNNIPLQDGYQAGMIGLCEAAKNFDPAKQVKFLSYAVFWIEFEVRSLCHRDRSGHTVYINVRSRLATLERAIDFRTRNQRQPTESELASMSQQMRCAHVRIDRLGLDVVRSQAMEVRKDLSRVVPYCSIYAPVKPGTTLELIDTISDPNFETDPKSSLLDMVLEYMVMLPKRECTVLYAWIFDEMTLREISARASDLGLLSPGQKSLSYESIRKIKNTALAHLWLIMDDWDAFVDHPTSQTEFVDSINHAFGKPNTST